MLPSYRKAMVERMLLKTGTFLKWVPPKGEEGTMEKVLKICGLGAFQIQVLTRHENQRDCCWRMASVSRTHPRGKTFGFHLCGSLGLQGVDCAGKLNDAAPSHLGQPVKKLRTQQKALATLLPGTDRACSPALINLART